MVVFTKQKPTKLGVCTKTHALQKGVQVVKEWTKKIAMAKFVGQKKTIDARQNTKNTFYSKNSCASKIIGLQKGASKARGQVLTEDGGSRRWYVHSCSLQYV